MSERRVRQAEHRGAFIEIFRVEVHENFKSGGFEMPPARVDHYVWINGQDLTQLILAGHDDTDADESLLLAKAYLDRIRPNQS